MANGDRVGPDEHVVRYARPSDYDRQVLNGSAFNRTAKDRDGVSVCRLGLFRPDKDADLAEVRRVMSTWLTLKANGCLAELTVGAIEEVGREVEQMLSVIEDALAADPPRLANPAHALIDGLPFAGASEATLSSELASDLLVRRVLACHPAVVA